MKNIRLDKFLADVGVGTRSEVKKLIRQGRVFIGDVVCTKPETKLDAETEVVSVNGEEIKYRQFEYYMLNKPAGVVSATKDNRDRTVLDLVKTEKNEIFPVGRLDKDTEGLLLLTNDGELAHNLLSPKKHVDKKYFVKTDVEFSSEDSIKFQEGLDIGEEKLTLPARLEIMENKKEAFITIHEGKFHQIKRMCHAVGKEVVYLKRMTMGSLILDESLKPGEYRRITEDELEGLKGEK